MTIKIPLIRKCPICKKRHFVLESLYEWIQWHLGVPVFEDKGFLCKNCKSKSDREIGWER